MKPDMKMLILLTLLSFAGIQARILQDYAKDQSVTKTKGSEGTIRTSSAIAAAENHLRLSTSLALQHLTSRSSVTEIVCKWLINATNWSGVEIIICDKVAKQADLGRTPRTAPPPPRPAPGTRPLVA